MPEYHSRKQFVSDHWWILAALPGSDKVATLMLDQEALNYVGEALEDQRVSVAKLPDVSQVEAERSDTQISSDHKIEQFISNLLRYGVLLASTIVFVGGVLYLIRHGAEPAKYQFFQGEPSEFCSPLGVVRAALSGSRRGIIQLGILLLIATPVVRVTYSFLAFLQQRDFTYVFVTSFVLAGLIYSLIGAYF